MASNLSFAIHYLWSLLNCPVPRFPFLLREDSCSAYLRGLLWRLNVCGNLLNFKVKLEAALRVLSLRVLAVLGQRCFGIGLCIYTEIWWVNKEIGDSSALREACSERWCGRHRLPRRGVTLSFFFFPLEGGAVEREGEFQIVKIKKIHL